MDVDVEDQDGQQILALTPAGDDGGRQGGFRRAVKRVRKFFVARPSAKAVKRSSREIPGAAPGARQQRTPSPVSHFEQPATQEYGSEPLGALIVPYEQLQAEQPPPARASEERLSAEARLPERPRLPVSAYSDGNITSCPIAHDAPPTPPLPAACSLEHLLERPHISPTPDSPQQAAAPTRKSKATALFAKYGLPFDPEGVLAEELPDEKDNPAPRVNKQARVRVHYHCHRCSMAVGSNGICIVCGHRRCRKCERWPERKNVETSSLGSKGGRRSMPSSVHSSTRSETLDNWLAAPSRPTTSRSCRTISSLFSRDGVFLSKSVRRLCHVCHSPFIWTETRCQDCDHALCDACPRDPPRDPPRKSREASPLPSAPPVALPQAGNVRERVMKKPRIRVKYTCEHCGSAFEEGKKVCGSCRHVRCVHCNRWPPRSKREEKPSAEAVKAFQQRMASFPG